jgi:hypothetical protein
MMLTDLTALLAGGGADHPTDAIVQANLLGKPSIRSREAALSRDPAGRPLLALLTALARDPMFRNSAAAVLTASPGERVRWPAIVAAFEATDPGRLGEKMAKSFGQNAASSWTQVGFLAGAVRKQRVRSNPTPTVAAYAALLASLCGFGGRRLLESRWLTVLDRPVEDRLALLRQAEGLGLLRVRSAGDVLEVDVRRQMAETLGVPELVG